MTDGLFPSHTDCTTGSCLSAVWMTSDPTAECCNLEAIRGKEGGEKKKKKAAT